MLIIYFPLPSPSTPDISILSTSTLPYLFSQTPSSSHLQIFPFFAVLCMHMTILSKKKPTLRGRPLSYQVESDQGIQVVYHP